MFPAILLPLGYLKYEALYYILKALVTMSGCPIGKGTVANAGSSNAGFVALTKYCNSLFHLQPIDQSK